MHLGGPGVKFQPRHRLYWLRISWFTSDLTEKSRDNTSLSSGCFLPSPFQLIIHQTSHHSTCIFYTVTALQNEQHSGVRLVKSEGSNGLCMRPFRSNPLVSGEVYAVVHSLIPRGITLRSQVGFRSFRRIVLTVFTKAQLTIHRRLADPCKSISGFLHLR
jgi:hypothetical protein